MEQLSAIATPAAIALFGAVLSYAGSGAAFKLSRFFIGANTDNFPEVVDERKKMQKRLAVVGAVGGFFAGLIPNL